MVLFRATASAIVCWLATPSWAANLLVSHYTGNLYSLSLTNSGTNNQLAITSTLKAGGGMPSWLTLDSNSKTLYVTDESQYPSPVLTALQVQSDGSLRSINAPRSPGAELHSAFYGGSDGKGFLATAE
jgi:6-phosphogluconolactonase (cycloisomerase 2 family)